MDYVSPKTANELKFIQEDINSFDSKSNGFNVHNILSKDSKFEAEKVNELLKVFKECSQEWGFDERDFDGVHILKERLEWIERDHVKLVSLLSIFLAKMNIFYNEKIDDLNSKLSNVDYRLQQLEENVFLSQYSNKDTLEKL